MASTRSRTGNSRPRVFAPAETTSTTKTTTRKKTTKRAAGGARTTTANTSKRRAPATKKTGTTGGRVTKTGGTTTAGGRAGVPVEHHKRKSHLGDKIEGVALKIEGTLTGHEGKKAAGTKKIRGTDGKHARKERI